MPSNFTEHYHLSQWEKTDQVLMDDFNADNAKIDAAIKAVDRRVDGKADASALSGLSGTVSGQGSTLSRKGNCVLYTTSYVGSGLSGKENPMSLSFPRKPYLVIISGGSRGRHLIMIQGLAESTVEVSGQGYTSELTWSGSSVSWWCNGSSAPYMMTEKDITYRVVAFLKADD